MPAFHSLATSVQLSVPNILKSSAMSTSTRQSTANSNMRRRLEGFPRAEDEHVLPEESLFESGSLEFLGERKDMPFFLVRAGKDLFKAKQETGRGRGSVARRQLPVRTPSPERMGSVGSSPDIPKLATALASVAEFAIEDQKADGGDGQSPVARRSSFGRLIRQKGSPSSFHISSHRSSLTQPKSTAANTAASDSISSRTSTSPLSVHRPGLPKTPEPGAAASTPTAPLPLTLTVTLNPPSWAIDPRKKIYSQDVKIDIFLNGEFTASRIILARHREAGWGGISEIFSGRRVELRQERVWVLVPPGQNADGTLREPKRAKTALHPAAERWAEIGQTLQEESDRWGQNIWGERSCVGEYLECLAKTVKLPEALEHIQKPGGQKYSVMDVVICLGKVGKRELPYLRAPKRITDPRFSNLNEEGREEMKNSENAGINRTKPLPSVLSPAKNIAGPNDDKLSLQDSSSPYSANKVFVAPWLPLPPFRRDTSKSISAPGLRRSIGRNKAPVAVPNPQTPSSLLTLVPDPLKPNKKYSAEQNRRLQDLTLIPVRPRPEGVIIPVDISHGHPAPVSALPKPITPSIQGVSDEISSGSAEPTPQHTPKPKGTTAPRGRGRLRKTEDDSPVGKPENLPQKRYRYADVKPLETPVKKRKSKMDDLSSTLNESIWGVGAVATRYGVTPADAPAMSTRSRGRSRSAAAPDRGVFESTPTDDFTRDSRSSSKEASIVEPETPIMTPCPTNPKANNNSYSSTAPTAPKTTKPNPSSTTEPRSPRSRLNVATNPAHLNTMTVQLPDPFYSSSPTPTKAAWNPSPLSQDAVLAYAEGSAWEGSADQQIQRVVSDIPVKRGDVAYRGEKMEGVREVRMERAASFEQESVLMGVRFIVG